mmetsp:Transcript_12476/g.25842  ORF Transcript_12476/g.25842 Transcript_12476/m.25842 type:complete len:90 (-) Transcript_12476:238-507(-)
MSDEAAPAPPADTKKDDENIVLKVGHKTHDILDSAGQAVVDLVNAGAGVNAHGTNVDHQVNTTEINKVVDAGAGVNAHGTNVDHAVGPT